MLGVHGGTGCDGAMVGVVVRLEPGLGEGIRCGVIA